MVIPWTESTRGGPGPGRAVHCGPTVVWTEGTKARQRAHRSMASGHSGAQKLAGGGTIERGEQGELGSGLTGARAATRWPGDGGKRLWQSVLGGVRVADSGAIKGGRG
jgi:hypothetical protein